jgi:hypothetical protein
VRVLPSRARGMDTWKPAAAAPSACRHRLVSTGNREPKSGWRLWGPMTIGNAIGESVLGSSCWIISSPPRSLSLTQPPWIWSCRHRGLQRTVVTHVIHGIFYLLTPPAAAVGRTGQLPCSRAATACLAIARTVDYSQFIVRSSSWICWLLPFPSQGGTLVTVLRVELEASQDEDRCGARLGRWNKQTSSRGGSQEHTSSGMVPWTLELAVGEADQHASRVADPGKTGTQQLWQASGPFDFTCPCQSSSSEEIYM